MKIFGPLNRVSRKAGTMVEALLLQLFLSLL